MRLPIMPKLSSFAPLALSVASALTFISSPAAADKQGQLKPEITITTEPSVDGKTQTLHVIVRGVSDYCSTDANTTVLRNSESIRIVRDRPSKVSRCMGSADRAFVITDVAPGRYMVSYEMMPYIAPARPIRIVWTQAIIE